MRIILPAALCAVALTTAALAAPQRLDGGFFATVSGDPAAMAKALADTEAALTTNPNDADILIEHGVLSLLVAGRSNPPSLPKLNAALAEMDRAAALAPDNQRVRTLRGIFLHLASQGTPPAVATGLMEKARTDFQYLYERQATELDQLGEHRLGELLQIKGDLESRLGRTGEASATYAMIKAKLPRTPYAQRADEWMKTRTPLPSNQTTCIGCHDTP